MSGVENPVRGDASAGFFQFWIAGASWTAERHLPGIVDGIGRHSPARLSFFIKSLITVAGASSLAGSVHRFPGDRLFPSP